jgi:hypothetical protein
VGTQSMTLLAHILQGDRTDLDLIQLTLETLANVVTYEVGNDEGIFLFFIRSFLHIFISHIEQANLPQDITVQFTGINLHL